MKDKFIKNGVFSLEYDKETLRDIVLELQEENKQLEERINKALNKIDNMFDRGDTNTIIDDLLELDKILKGSDSK